MNVVAIAILALCTCALYGKVLKWTTNPYLIPPMPNSPTQYLVFHGQLALNQTLSRLRCEAMGGDLADVDDEETFKYIYTRLHAPSFVGSWLGDRFRETCIAVYPGGAVAIPESGCGRLGSICEVPIYGTHGIDLRSLSIPADPKAKIGVYGKPDNSSIADEHVEILEKSFIKPRQQQPGAHQKSGKAFGSTPSNNPVTTITIYGSIETDPALPCCKCCNPI